MDTREGTPSNGGLGPTQRPGCPGWWSLSVLPRCCHPPQPLLAALPSPNPLVQSHTLPLSTQDINHFFMGLRMDQSCGYAPSH
jgi:hypothetical protein